MKADQNGRRKLFHKPDGSFDSSRLMEHAIPLAMTAAVMIWSNSIISGQQIIGLKEQANRTETAVASLQIGLNNTNVETAKLNAQVVAFLGQQVTLNAAMDARLTYLERASRDNGVTVIQPPASATTIQPRQQQNGR